jgi:hypothetical protein
MMFLMIKNSRGQVEALLVPRPFEPATEPERAPCATVWDRLACVSYLFTHQASRADVVIRRLSS